MLIDDFVTYKGDQIKEATEFWENEDI